MKRVLIVDDNVSFTEFLDATVRAAGHETRIVHNGIEAMEAWNELHPDLVFLDVLLPKMDGFKVCRRMREEENGNGPVPIVLMTGIYTKRAYQQDALSNYGASDYLVKPFAIGDIWQILERRLGEGARTFAEDEPGTPLPESEREAFGGVRLRDRPLALILAELHDQEKSGLLFLKGRDSTDVFFFEKGQLVFVRSNDLTQRLDKVLERAGVVTREQVEEARELMVQSRGRSRMGEILVSLGHLDQERLRSTVQAQLRGRIQRAFRDDELAFTFVEGPLPQDEDIRVPLDTHNLILEGIREMPDEMDFSPFLPGEGAKLEAGRRAPEGLHLTAFERQVLDLARGGSTIEQILGIGRLAQIDVGRTLFTLLTVGLLHPSEASPQQAETSEEDGEGALAEPGPFPYPPGGNLALLPPSRVLAALHGAGRSGILEMTRGETHKALYLRDGQIVFASSNDPEDRLGEVLVEGGILRADTRDEMMERLRQRPGSRLGQILVEEELLGLEELQWAVVFQVQRIVTSCLAWTEGRYRYCDTQDALEESITVELRTPDLLLEGLRRVPLEAVERLLPRPERQLVPTQGARSAIDELRLTAQETDVWRAIEGGGATLRDLQGRDLGEEGAAARAVHLFLALDLVEEAPQKPSAADRTTSAPKAKADSSPSHPIQVGDLLDDLAQEAEEAVGGPEPPSVDGSSGPAEEREPVPRFLYDQLVDERVRLESDLTEARSRIHRARRRVQRVERSLQSLQKGLENRVDPPDPRDLASLLGEMIDLCSSSLRGLAVDAAGTSGERTSCEEEDV